MKQALVIIDVQEIFFADPQNPVYNAAALVENINRLIAVFRRRKEPIIFVRHAETDGEYFRQGSPEWQVYSKLNFEPEDIFVDKTTPDSFLNTDLLSVLNARRVTSIVVAGLQTDYCVDTTCRSAFGKNIKAVLVSDAHSTYDNQFMKAAETIDYHNRIIGRWFAELKPTAELL